MTRPRIVYVVGARPNYMKVAPVYAELEQRRTVEQVLVHTGQHYDSGLKDVFFAELPLPQPHFELRVGSGSHAQQTAEALVGLEKLFVELKPTLVLVPGDVNSTLAGALAAVKLGVLVCHLEAGLRSFDWSMPEEHNRRLTDAVSHVLLTHSEEANANLAREGTPPGHVRFVGNTMVDTLRSFVEAATAEAEWARHGLQPGGYVLVTLHRPALVDRSELLMRTMASLATLAQTFPVVFPVHPRTRARIEEGGIEVGRDVHLIDPLPYVRFLSLEAAAAGVVTDSGGVQEETTALGVPCFTLRANTERPVTVSVGTNTLLGLSPESVADVPRFLKQPKQGSIPPLWDGKAAARAADALEQALEVGADQSPCQRRW